MTKLLLLIIIMSPILPAHAQPAVVQREAPKTNIIKINIGSLIVKNFAFQYERVLGSNTSVAVGLRFQPFGTIPFQGWVKDQVNDPDIQVGQIRIGNFAFTPEFRYYFTESLHGLYLAPYFRYASYQMDAPVTYTGTADTRTAIFSGNIRSYSGGLLFGSQFRLSNSFVLDWWILGAHFGGSSGQLDFVSPLTPSEQEDLRSTLNEVDIPFFDIEHEIDANGGKIRSEGAWAGFRGFAVNLGWRF